MKCAEEIWTFHTSTEAMRFLSWSRADLLASAYDGIPYQHCHQNLKAWSSENRPFLRESELEYKFHPFSIFQFPVFGNVIDAGLSVSGLDKRLISLPKLILH